MEIQKAYLSYSELSQLTGLNINTLYSFVRKKQIPHERITSRLVRFNKAKILEWIDSKQVQICK